METSISNLFRTRPIPSLEGHNRKHPVARAMKKIPNEAYLGFAVACCGAATGLALTGKTKAAIVLCAWAPTAILAGLYARHKLES
jgi:hypothetical protein